ncbi:hypothetical protein GCM10027035_12680 [Emticicia sediminis]
MKKFSTTKLFILGIIIFILFITSCNKEEILETSSTVKKDNVTSLSKNSRVPYDIHSQLKKDFGIALGKSLKESLMLRKILKQEALEMFNNDNEVLYEMIEDEVLENGIKTSTLIEKHLERKNVLKDLMKLSPTLTILVPNLPNESFNAKVWDVESQIPRVAIRLSSTNDVPIFNTDGSEYFLEGQIPGFPVIVVKDNERIIEQSNSAFTKNTNRVIQTKSGKRFKFLSENFDRKKGTKNRLVFSNEIDSKLIQAYNTYNGIDGWHRDLIYYNISPANDKGAFSYSFKDGLTSFTMAGNAQSAYQKISDQTGDPLAYGYRWGNDPQWTGGSYEFKVSCLINAKNGIGTELITYFSALPSELFNLSYTRIVNHLFGPDEYILSEISFNKKFLSLPILNWDLDNYATSIKISIEEVDITTTTTQSETSSVKFASNFGIDNGTLKKIGLKFGASLETNQTQTYQRVFTQGNDELGSVIINFADNVIINQLTPTSYTTREYQTGFYSISFEPIRVQ